MQKDRPEIGISETKIGKRLNEEISLIRAGNTRWGSHFRRIVSLVNLFAKVLAVLKYVKEEGYLVKASSKKDQKYFGSGFLSKKDKKGLLLFRNDGFPLIWKKVCAFCENDSIGIVEFGDRFSKLGTELMDNMAALSPCDSFSSFGKAKLLKLIEIYKNDFVDSKRHNLMGNMISRITDLSCLLVETGKHISFHLVYKLTKLTFFLPVSTTIVEQCFSAIKFLKTDLRNRTGDDFMNGALICSVEKEALENIKTKNVKKVDMLYGVTVVRYNNVKDELILDGIDNELKCVMKNKDTQNFLDGNYVSNKGKIEFCYN
ncbi:uncharacterized protein LOC111915409 [Lactuca sativa]|uniref:uncharacterized protein LOC111915409 n=1 Tax=Lactuca sativa TaxID=4236 RepID=UPI0022AF52FF|nr:uncharacterized protein LOC111915409 [Lactuca sativa]